MDKTSLVEDYINHLYDIGNITAYNKHTLKTKLSENNYEIALKTVRFIVDSGFIRPEFDTNFLMEKILEDFKKTS